MHELAIARNIHATVLREMEDRRLPGISRIGLSIGSLSGVVPDALADACLEIKNCPGRGSCTQCYAEFDMDDFSFSCPQCDSPDVRVESGRELDITWLEAPQ